MKTLVIGGTGTVGSRTVQELLKRGSSVRVMTRSAEKFSQLPDGVQGVVGDSADPNSLPAAFDGVDALFLATPLAVDETVQGLAVVEAAKAARLSKIVYMSVHLVESLAFIPHFATKLPIEYAVRTSGIDYTLIRPNNFYQNDYWFRDALRNYGVYPQPLGSAGVSRVDARDIAEAVAISITAPGHDGKAYTIAGPDALTGVQTAEMYSRHLGKPIHYVGDNLEGWAAEAAKAYPAWLVLDLKIMYAEFVAHGLRATPAEVAALTGLLGHAPRTFEAFVAETAADWNAR